MKIKHRPVKRKVFSDSSVECDGHDTSKKQCRISLDTAFAVGTTNVQLNGLQEPPMPINCDYVPNDDCELLANSTEYNCRSSVGSIVCHDSSKLLANINYANGRPTSQQQNNINTDMRRDIVDPYTVGTAGASERRINNNYRAKEQLSKAKDQNSSTDPKGQTMGKQRIRNWHKLYTHPVGTQYLNAEPVSTSTCKKLIYLLLHYLLIKK
ncbi:hypothetical protein Tco_1406110 [Tanacetum coccineum]